MNIYRRVNGSILLMATWLSFLRYVMTYRKGDHNRRKRIRNLRKFVDVIRCINLYIVKLYYVIYMVFDDEYLSI
jgi:hypothetical protein